ncbi:fructose-6-phosphate aldolase [Thermodesulfobium sp.]
MQIFLDTAKIDEIRKLVPTGVVDGVTTNPSLLAKAGCKDIKSAIQEICSMVKEPVSVEVIGTKADEMISEAREYSLWKLNTAIKIPMTDEGLKAVSVLSKEGIKTNVTLIFSTSQGLLAAKAGATFVSPFVGRLDDISHNGLEVVRDLSHIFKIYGFSTRIIAASIRHPIHVIESAKAGAHIATVPTKVLEAMFKHPLTDIGIERFLSDWKSLQASK